MATPKVITAIDLQLEKLTLRREGDTLHVERRYVFVDATNTVIDNLAGGRVIEEIPIANLPSNIAAALTDIDAWTYQQALTQEGMED